MKYSRIVILSLIAFAFMACDKSNNNEEDLGGKEVTQQFLADYNGDFQEQHSRADAGERLSISRDGQIEVLKIRQVGSKNNPAIPYETVCSYYLTGQIRYVVELFDETRERVSESGDTFLLPETHRLTFSVHQVTLTDELESNSTTNEACLNFQEEMNRNLPNYTYGMELFGSGTIRLHTSGGGDFEGEPTDSTVDEVYTRI